MANFDSMAIRDIDRAIFEAIPVAIPCLVCGEDIILTFEDRNDTAKICDKCKTAILKMRKDYIESKEEDSID